MQCEDNATTRATQAARIVMQIFTWAFALAVFAGVLARVALAETPEASASGHVAAQALEQARAFRLRFRDGELDVAGPHVALLDAAVKAEPGNADLWHALGLAYMNQAARAAMPGGDPADAMVAFQKGLPALNRALQLDPDHAEALTLRAGVRMLMGAQMNAPAMVTQAVADMNRGVELAPRSISIRLLRAFAGPNMPEELRDHRREAEDLDFLIEAAQWNRAGDYITILRGDLYFERGEKHNARTTYELVRNSASSASAMAEARLAKLEQGGAPLLADIKALRSVAGAECRLCHGRETTAP